MAWTQITETAKQSTDTADVTTSAIDTTGADLLVIGVSFHRNDTPFTVLDSKSNTWGALNVYVGSARRAQLYYARFGAIVGSGHTFSVNGAGSVTYPTIFVQAWSGGTTPASTFDSQAGAGNASDDEVSTGSATIAEANSLAISVVVADVAGTTPTATCAGFSLSNFYDSTPGPTAVGGAGLAWKENVSGSISADWTVASATDIAAALAIFKPAASPGGFLSRLSLLGAG